MNHKLITLENLKKFKEELNTADLKTFVKFGNDRLYIALAEQAPSSEWEDGETGILLSYYDLPDGWSVYNGIIVKDTRSDTTYSSSTGEDAQIKYKIISSLSGVSTEKEIVARSLSKAEFDLLPNEQKKTGYPYWLSDGYYVDANGTARSATSGNYYIRLGFPVSKGGIVGYEAPEGWHIYNNILLKDAKVVYPLDNISGFPSTRLGSTGTISGSYTVYYESGNSETRYIKARILTTSEYDTAGASKDNLITYDDYNLRAIDEGGYSGNDNESYEDDWVYQIGSYHKNDYDKAHPNKTIFGFNINKGKIVKVEPVNTSEYTVYNTEEGSILISNDIVLVDKTDAISDYQGSTYELFFKSVEIKVYYEYSQEPTIIKKNVFPISTYIADLLPINALKSSSSSEYKTAPSLNLIYDEDEDEYTGYNGYTIDLNGNKTGYILTTDNYKIGTKTRLAARL